MPTIGKGSFKKEDRLKEKNSLHYIHYSISMYSDESLIRERSKWDKIPFFYVAAEVLDI